MRKVKTSDGSALRRKETLRRVLRMLRPYRGLLLLSILAAAVFVAGELLIPIFTGNAIDAMIAAGRVEMPVIGKAVFSIAVCIAAAGTARYLMGLCNNRVTAKVTRDLRDAMMAKIEKIPLSRLDREPTGGLVSRMIADADTFADGLLLGFSQFFTGILTIVGTLGFMVRVNMSIALVVFCITPLSLIVASFIASRTFRFFGQQNEVRGAEAAYVNEQIEGMKAVQAFGREEETLAGFDSINGELQKTSLKAVFYSSLTNPATRFVNSVVYAGVVLAGALFAVGGSLSIGQLSVFLTYANRYTKPFNEISGVVTEMQNALSCAARIFDLLDAEEESPDGHLEELAAEDIDGTVEIDGVSFRYDPDVPLIDDFSLSVKPGQRIAIVGPTGCGKTTLINLLMRFYDVQGGSIRTAGRDVREVRRKSLRKSYGMVLQDTWLSSGTIHDNIAYGRPGATREEVVRAAKMAHAHGFIRRLSDGYDTVIKEDGGNLSQGEKQLLCIARVMLLMPPMLILDEATSSIDTGTEMRIQKAFRTMMEGRTSFIVAHRLSTIREADVILVMKDGHIIEKGKHRELLEKKGFYADLYNSQFRGVAI